MINIVDHTRKTLGTYLKNFTEDEQLEFKLILNTFDLGNIENTLENIYFRLLDIWKDVSKEDREIINRHMYINCANDEDKGLAIIHDYPKILDNEYKSKLDEMYDYIMNYKLNKLQTELNEFKNDFSNERTFSNSELTKQIKLLKKSEEYKFSDKERYKKFYKRIMDKLKVNLEENKELIKIELIRLKKESKNNSGIELTVEELEDLIEQIDVLINLDK